MFEMPHAGEERYFAVVLLSVLMLASAQSCAQPIPEDEGGEEVGDGNGRDPGEPDPLPCEIPYEICEGECTDVSRCLAHCGACGIKCFPGQECSSGACVGTSALSAAELHEAMEAKDFLLLNVRVPPVGIIPGTDGSYCNERPDLLADAIGPDELARVVVYCRTTPRSLDAIHRLRARGYSSISYLEGGVLAWLDAGYELE